MTDPDERARTAAAVDQMIAAAYDGKSGIEEAVAVVGLAMHDLWLKLEAAGITREARIGVLGGCVARYFTELGA